MEWYDSDVWYDTPEWYENEEEKLLDIYFSDDKYDNLKEFMSKYASKRFQQWTKNYRIQKKKDKERGIIVN